MWADLSASNAAKARRGGGSVRDPKVASMPAPIGGWNARDPLPNMAPEDAVVLDNIVPGTGAVRLRNGFAEHATGLGTYVESLMTYAPPAGSERMFAAAGGSIYNVTASGAVGAAVLTSLNNARWQHTMFATAAGNYLVAANGADDVINFDGTSWTTPTITGVTSSNLISVTRHIQRLWFVEKNTLDAWYLPVSSIAGAATKLPLGTYCKRGGSLAAIGSWSRDGGDGLDDVAVFVTTNGEVVLYSGIDPNQASTWQQVGVFHIPKPIGRRCLAKAGGDLAILTKVGLLPLSKILDYAESVQARIAVTDKISGAYLSAATSDGDAFGWQVIEYPKRKLLIVNVPVSERVEQRQFVMAADTGAWCRFTGLNAACWETLNDEVYFGGNDGKVYRYDSDYVDNGSTISAIIQQAFSNYGTNKQKLFVSARPLFTGPDGYTPSIEIKVDYDLTAPTLPASVAASSGSQWDTAIWDVDLWDAASVPRKAWQTITGLGLVGSIATRITLSREFTLNQTDVMFQEGGYL